QLKHAMHARMFSGVRCSYTMAYGFRSVLPGRALSARRLPVVLPAVLALLPALPVRPPCAPAGILTLPPVVPAGLPTGFRSKRRRGRGRRAGRGRRRGGGRAGGSVGASRP